MENRVGLHFLEEKLVTESEIEEKFKVMSGSAFDVLLQSSEKQHKEFLALIKKARAVESNAKKYFSTAVLQKKILTGFAKALDIPYHENVLKEIEEKENKQHEEFIQLIQKSLNEQKEQIKNKIIFERSALKSIEEMREALVERVEKFKNSLIDTLIQIVKDYQAFLKEKTDEKYGLVFLHKLNLLRKNTLTEVIAATNEIFVDAYTAKERDALLNIANNQLTGLANHWRGFFRLEYGGFYKYLRAIRLVQTEDEIINTPVAEVEKDYKKTIIEHDALLLKIIKDSLIPLQEKAAEEAKNIAQYSDFLKEELFVGVHSLRGPSEKCYKQIASRNANMKIQNSEARTHAIAQINALNTVQIAYENGIQMAKQKDQNEFLQQETMAGEALHKAKEEMEKANECLKSLQILERINQKDLETAKEFYDGGCHRVLDAQFSREVKKMEKRKVGYLAGQKQYNEARILPKALKIYGEMIFQCAEMKEKMLAVSGQLKNNLAIGQSIWAFYDEILTAAHQQKTEELIAKKQLIDEHLLRLRETTEKEKEVIAWMNTLKTSLEEKLREAKKEFAPDLHEEHQEIFDLTQMQFVDLLKQEAIAKQMSDSIENISNAVKEYSAILTRLALIREKVLAGKEALATMQLRVERLEKMYQETLVLASIGVKNSQMKVLALEQYAEAQKMFLSTMQMLKMAGDERLAEQKALSEAKAIFSKEMHVKPAKFFDELNGIFSETIIVKKSAEMAFASIHMLPQRFDEAFANADRLFQQKKIAGELRGLMLDAILNNLPLWHIGKWGGGVDYQFAGHTYRIPHGVLHLITALSTITDNKECLLKAKALANERILMGRTQWKYRFFNIRDDETTGVLYHAIQSIQLTDYLTEKSVLSLQSSLQKISGMQLSIPLQRAARAH